LQINDIINVFIAKMQIVPDSEKTRSIHGAVMHKLARAFNTLEYILIGRRYGRISRQHVDQLWKDLNE
jgi:predicted nucleic acid-binding protein